MDVNGYLPKFESMRDYGTRERNTRFGFTVQDDFVIPLALRVTLNVLTFYQHDFGVNSRSRFVIFFN